MPRILLFLREPERSAMTFSTIARLPGVTFDIASTLAEAAPSVAGADILITLAPHLGEDAAALIAAMPNLKWVQLITTGADDMAELLSGTGIVLTTAHGLHGAQMSEAALAAMLALSRDIPRLVRQQRAREWSRYPAALMSGSTVGIVGLGAIAEALAPRCRALGMRVVGITGTPRPVAGFDEVRTRGDMARAVAGLDHLVLLTPYSAATHRLVDAQVLGAMKRGAYVINLARGGVLDEAALLEALDTGQIGGAALDVFEVEPLPETSPLWTHPKIIVSPHVGGFHDGYAQDVEALVADNLRRFAAGGAAALLNSVPLPEPLHHAAQ